MHPTYTSKELDAVIDLQQRLYTQEAGLELKRLTLEAVNSTHGTSLTEDDVRAWEQVQAFFETVQVNEDLAIAAKAVARMLPIHPDATFRSQGFLDELIEGHPHKAEWPLLLAHEAERLVTQHEFELNELDQRRED